jgi:uncharacterized DUF497 family protein
MAVGFDPEKRDWTLATRGLDFADAEQVFDGLTLSLPDLRRDYGEERIQTYGLLGDRMVMVVWTWREEQRHIISIEEMQ